MNNFAKGIPPEFSWLNDLNQQQQEAVRASDGPVLVVAGAGTGKTKTLAYHVARLVCTGVDPGRIMLLTFTRRAAEGMIRRANAIVRLARPETSDQASRIWGGTFHAMANRLLRIYAKTIGLEESFTVLDQADAEDLMNVVRHERGLNGKDKQSRGCAAKYVAIQWQGVEDKIRRVAEKYMVHNGRCAYPCGGTSGSWYIKIDSLRSSLPPAFG